MTARRTVAVALAILCVAVGLLLLKGNPVWPFASDRKDLGRLLGVDAAAWLEDAEIVAWQPDLNLKPQSYFVVRPMSADEFRAWAAAAQLTTSDAPAALSGVFVPPPQVKLKRWLPPAPELAGAREAEGRTPAAVIWSRWQQGIAYTVVQPIY